MKKRITLSEETLGFIVQKASETAVDKYKAEHEETVQARKDKRYHDTKKLLKNYRALKDYTDHTIYDMVDIEDGEDICEALSIFNETGRVQSIKERIVFTKVTMENVTRALEAYKEFCMKSDKPEVRRRWRELYALYLSGEGEEVATVQSIADTERIAERTVYDDIDRITEDMEARFFGLELDFFN